MKKILLFITLCLLLVTSTKAQDGNELWNKTKAVAREAGKEVSKEHLAVTTDGELYAAGTFSTAFPFAGQDLEPIANSSYLIKYSATGEELWGVSVAGAAAVNGITLDDAGNIYLIGRLTDAVVFNTTSGDAVTKTGNTGTDLISAFVAKYSSTGVLQAVEVFVPTKLDIEYDATPELFFTNIQVANGKAYVSAMLKGKISNNEVALTSKTANIWGIGYYLDMQSGYVISLTSDLKFEAVISELSATEDNGLTKFDVYDATFAIENNVMYLGYVATGNQTLKIGTEIKNITLNTPEGGAWQYVYQLAAYNLDTKTNTLYKDYVVEHDAGYNRCRISKLTPIPTGLIVEGTYNGAPLAFDNSLTHIGANDVFSAKLNKTDLTVIKAFTSGIDEGDANKNEEVLVASSSAENNLQQLVQTNVVGEKPIASYTINIDYEKNTMGAATSVPTFFGTGISSKGNKAAVAVVNPESAVISYHVAELILSSVRSQQLTGISVHLNPLTNEVIFSETCDATVINIAGSTLKTVQSVEKVNVSDLTSGVYLISVSNSKGRDTFKVLKK